MIPAVILNIFHFRKKFPLFFFHVNDAAATRTRLYFRNASSTYSNDVGGIRTLRPIDLVKFRLDTWNLRGQEMFQKVKPVTNVKQSNERVSRKKKFQRLVSDVL